MSESIYYLHDDIFELAHLCVWVRAEVASVFRHEGDLSGYQSGDPQEFDLGPATNHYHWFNSHEQSKGTLRVQD